MKRNAPAPVLIPHTVSPCFLLPPWQFLFSFFHTLGMQEKSDNNGSDNSGVWVRRFEAIPKTNKLRLTKDTTKLLGEAYAAFQLALHRVVKELFDGDESIRWLLLQYVTLQLFSDASFCLQKWTTKVGTPSLSSITDAVFLCSVVLHELIFLILFAFTYRVVVVRETRIIKKGLRNGFGGPFGISTLHATSIRKGRGQS